MRTPLLDRLVKHSELVLYHGTEPTLVDKIISEGLDPEKMREYPWIDDPRKAVFLTSDKNNAKTYARLKSEGLLKRLFGGSKSPVLRVTFPDKKSLGGFINVYDRPRKGDEWHYTDKIPPEWISVVKESHIKTPLLDGVCKVAGSVLREAVGFRYSPFIEGAERGTWEMFLKKDPTKAIGEIMIKGKPGESARIIHSDIIPQWRGKGLGKKMYGEIIRRHPVVMSDKVLSPHSFNTWKGLARRSTETGLNVKKLLPVKSLKLAKGAPELFHISGPSSIFAAQPTKASQIGKFRIPKLPKAGLLKKLFAKLVNVIELKALSKIK